MKNTTLVGEAYRMELRRRWDAAKDLVKIHSRFLDEMVSTRVAFICYGTECLATCDETAECDGECGGTAYLLVILKADNELDRDMLTGKYAAFLCRVYGLVYGLDFTRVEVSLKADMIREGDRVARPRFGLVK